MQINTGNPEKNGMYVCYVDLTVESKFMEKKLLFWYDYEWMYPGSDQRCRECVNCWIGPLPSPTKDDLNKDQNVRYGIASKNQAEDGAFVHGPFETLSQATEVIGDYGEYIFKLEKDKKFKPVRKWSSKRGWIRKKNTKKSTF